MSIIIKYFDYNLNSVLDINEINLLILLILVISIIWLYSGLIIVMCIKIVKEVCKREERKNIELEVDSSCYLKK